MSAELNSASLPLYAPTSWAGVVPETEQAYDIRATRIDESRRVAAFSRANGILCDGISKVEFFIHEMTLNAGISGKTSQSRYTRDFYANNIILPSLAIKAQCLDQGDYGVLTEFVHQAQRKAVGNSATNVTQLEVKGGWKAPKELGASGLAIEAESEKGSERPIMRGTHKRTCAQGFIPRIERKYKQGEYAPTFSFNFTVIRSFEGIYEGIAASIYENEQASWVEILEGLTTPYQPTFRKQETATNSKPKETPAPLPEPPPEPKVELVSSLPGGGGL